MYDQLSQLQARAERIGTRYYFAKIFYLWVFFALYSAAWNYYGSPSSKTFDIRMLVLSIVAITTAGICLYEFFVGLTNVPCPKCSENLYWVIRRPHNGRAFQKQNSSRPSVCLCPYCGVKFGNEK